MLTYLHCMPIYLYLGLFIRKTLDLIIVLKCLFLISWHRVTSFLLLLLLYLVRSQLHDTAFLNCLNCYLTIFLSIVDNNLSCSPVPRSSVPLLALHLLHSTWLIHPQEEISSDGGKAVAVSLKKRFLIGSLPKSWWQMKLEGPWPRQSAWTFASTTEQIAEALRWETSQYTCVRTTRSNTIIMSIIICTNK